MSTTQFDAKDFRRALSQFPTGVTVITALDAEGNPVGVTASSFNSVSMDPTLVLWSIDKGAHSLSTFENTEHFAVNVLNRDQVSTSNNFASRGEDKFANAAYSAGLGGAPILDDYAAQFECKTWAVYEGGDHLILVGEVLDYRYNDSAEPLVFARGSYAISAQHPEMAKSSAACDAKAVEGDFVGDYLLYLLRETYQRFSADLYPKLKSECDVTAEEWRILARMVTCPVIKLSDLSTMVMQPDVALRETADWMVDKGLVMYQGDDALKITEKGSKVGLEMQSIALAEESALLSQLPPEQAEQLKVNLKCLMEKLG
ncbi:MULTISPECIES: flavin reductase family protein [unclassified Neptuniibacter]|uniref:flavin reductase family protein n=1 Tax=unclassified Neptuniibacter TaxID=2630693 RepID=UPI000C47D7B9|nr:MULTISPECIES: flavin reductase family protein [unclassified Neptuniibacter]MAY43286.1 nitrilotriacetate monooxygenase [Oceanospirillaceae bacterium]|tara:strand:+ start:15404 stop:16348 length:945 start_codon:yes stop_codon:yes gene_type:complete